MSTVTCWLSSLQDSMMLGGLPQNKWLPMHMRLEPDSLSPCSGMDADADASSVSDSQSLAAFVLEAGALTAKHLTALPGLSQMLSPRAPGEPLSLNTKMSISLLLMVCLKTVAHGT